MYGGKVENQKHINKPQLWQPKHVVITVGWWHA